MRAKIETIETIIREYENGSRIWKAAIIQIAHENGYSADAKKTLIAFVEDLLKIKRYDEIYNIFGCKPATIETIKEEIIRFFEEHGYRKSMMKYHPDHGGETWAAQLVNQLAGK